MNKTINHLQNIMRKAVAAFCIIAALVSMAFFAYGQDQQSKKLKQILTFSNDGKFLVDSTGKKVEQYLESAKAFVPITDANKSNCHPCNCGP